MLNHGRSTWPPQKLSNLLEEQTNVILSPNVIPNEFRWVLVSRVLKTFQFQPTKLKRGKFPFVDKYIKNVSSRRECQNLIRFGEVKKKENLVNRLFYYRQPDKILATQTKKSPVSRHSIGGQTRFRLEMKQKNPSFYFNLFFVFVG